MNGNQTNNWRPVEQVAAELRHECSAVELLVQQLFGDIDRLRDELERRADEVEEARRRLAERGRQLAEQRKEAGRLVHQFEQQETHLSEALGELRALRQQLNDERDEARQREATQIASLQARLEQAEAERNDLRRQVESLQLQVPASEGDSLAPLLSELGELRRQMQETQAELAGAIDRAAASRAEAPSSAVPSSELTQQIVALERERAELESELELVRTRATELQETVGQQKRELSEQRDELAAELKLLRQIVEQQSELMAAPVVEEERREPVAVARPAAVPDEVAAASDPVVSSVMAQFARLQKDVAQRRKKK